MCAAAALQHPCMLRVAVCRDARPSVRYALCIQPHLQHTPRPLLRCRASSSSSADGNGSTPSKLTTSGVTDLKSLTPEPRKASEEFAVLSQFSQVHPTEMVGGCLYVVLMAEVRACLVPEADDAEKG